MTLMAPLRRKSVRTRVTHSMQARLFAAVDHPDQTCIDVPGPKPQPNRELATKLVRRLTAEIAAGHPINGQSTARQLRMVLEAWEDSDAKISPMPEVPENAN